MKQKTRILIYILAAIAVVIIGSMAIITNHQSDKPASAQEHIDLGRIYLTDLSYEKASLEFTEAIEIEPLNADAYLGLAEAYAGMGDTEKAVEILKEGYDRTDDERLKNMLEELLPPVPEETAVTTTAAITTTEETTTTVAMAVVPDLLGLTEEEAIAACESAGLKYSVSYGYSDEIEKGYVIGQTIPVNASVAEGISVPFTVSEGVKVATTMETTALTMPAPAEEFITIKGVQYSTSLTILELNRMELTNEDIKDLDKMINLTSLSLWHNQISDISTLSELTNLTNLYLHDNQISNISVLSGLTNLTYLNLSGNQFSNNDVNDLSNLTNLISLGLSSNQISDISSLKNLTNLTELWLWNNQISDISALKNLTNLTELWLGNNQISDISALKDLTNLTKLDLRNNQISNEDVENLKKALPNCEIRT